MKRAVEAQLAAQASCGTQGWPFLARGFVTHSAQLEAALRPQAQAIVADGTAFHHQEQTFMVAKCWLHLIAALAPTLQPRL